MTAPIPLSTETEAVVTAAKAIITRHKRTFFSRGRVVEVVPDLGLPRILPLRRSRVRGLLEMGRLSFRPPPAWLVSHLLEGETWPEMMPLTGVTDVPVLRPDGTPIAQQGYDEPTGLWFEPSFPLQLSESPTRADAQAAFQELEALANHFPLQSRAHRSSFIAALLTPFVTLDGPAPLFLFDSPSRGWGASEAADLISLIVRGSPQTRLEPPASARQLRRQLARIGDSEETFIHLDGTDDLTCRAALETAVKDLRWLDGARPGERRRRLMWSARTVNSQLTRESADFVLPIRFLDSLDQGLGPTWLPPRDLLEKVRKERSRYARAALTLLRAYVVAGAPAVKVGTWSGFEAWSELIARAIVWSGCEDPTLARRANQAALVDDGTDFREAMIALTRILTPKTGLTTPELLDALASNGAEARACREALSRLLGTEDFSCRLLGHFLSRHRGRCVEGWFIQRVGTASAGYSRWTIVRNPFTRDAAVVKREPRPWDVAEEDVRVAEGSVEFRLRSPKAPVEKVGDYVIPAAPPAPLPRNESDESRDVSCERTPGGLPVRSEPEMRNLPAPSGTSAPPAKNGSDDVDPPSAHST